MIEVQKPPIVHPALGPESIPEPIEILLVERDEDEAERVCGALRGAGVRFSARRVATEADLLRELEGRLPDLILSADVSPGLDAPRVLELLRAGGLDVPCIQLSESGGEERAVQSIKCGADDFLCKADLERLGSAVQQVLDTERNGERSRRSSAHRRATDERVRKLADTHTAILNALPAHVCLLDEHGVVVAVNEAWRRFGVANAIQPGYEGVGTSYLEVCERADGPCADEAHAAAAGIRRVLAGETREFSLEYPCHSSVARRWFRMMVTPLYEDDPGGVVVTHVDITQRKLAEDALRASEARLRAIVDGEPECVKTVSPDGRLLEMNPAGLRMIQAASLEQVAGRNVLELIHPDDRERFAALHRRVTRGESGEMRFRIVGLEGRERWMETYSTPLRDPDGAIVAVLSVTRDVSEHERLERIQRCEAEVLAGISSGRPLREILEATALGVEQVLDEGMVSVLLLDEEGAHVRHGSAPHLPAAYVAAIDGAAIGPSAGSCGTAAHRKEPVVVADIATDPLWHDYRDLALAHDLRACWSTPVLDTDGRVLATFAVYHRTPHQPTAPEQQVVDRAVYLVRLAVQRAQREAALRTSETRFRRTFRDAATGIAVSTIDGRFLEANEAFCRMLGYAEDELRALDFQSVTHPDDLDRNVALFADLRDGRRDSYVVEKRYRAKGGRVVWARVSVAAIGDAGDAKQSFVAVAEDITEQRLAQARLEASEAQYRLLFANNPQPAWVYDRETLRFLEVNAAAVQHYGYTRDEFLAMTIADIRPPEEIAALREAIARAGVGVQRAGKWRHRAKDGRLFSVEVSWHPIEFHGCRAMLALAQDVSERERAEQEREQALAREREARREADAASRYYRSLFECAPGCYVVLTPGDYEIVAVSEAYLQATMTTRAQLQGRRLFDVFPDDPADLDADGVRNLRASLARVEELCRTDVLPVQRYPIRRPESAGGGWEERWWSPVNTPVPGPDGRTAFIIHRVEDVTEYVRYKRQTGTWSDAEQVLASRREQIEADIVLRSHELKRAHEQLAQSTSSLRMASRISRMGAWYLDVSGPEPRLEGSPEIHEILGLPPDHVPDPTREFERYLPESRATLTAAIEACVREGTGFDLQLRIRHASGKILWTRSIGEPARDAGGRIVGVQGAFQDITAQKEAEESLAASERRFRELADSMPIIVFTSLPDGDVDYANQAFTRYAGVPEDELADGGWLRAVHPDDIERSLTSWAASVASGQPHDVQFRIRREADGAYRWHQVRAIPVRDATGAIVKWYGSAADVDDVIRLERDATQLAGRLATTLDSITDAFFAVDREWRFTYWNAAAERMIGVPRDALLGKGLWDVFPDAVGSVFEREYAVAMAENVPRSFEAHYAPIDRWLEVRVYPSSEGLAGYFRDVTDLRAAREAMRESEERFRLLARATNDAIWDWDFGTDALWWNEGSETLFGYSRDEVEPTIDSWYRRIHPDDHDEVVGGVHRAVAAGEESWAMEYRFRRKDGTWAYVLDRGHVIRDASGKAIRMIGGMTDLTEHKQAEQRLAEQAALLDAAHEAIVVKDLEDRVIYWNHGAESTFGWRAAEALGQPAAELLAPPPHAYAEARRLLFERGEWHGEMTKRTKDGRELNVDVRWTLVRDAAGRAKSIFAIDSDVSERKKLEQQFLRAQRMESIGTLAGGIAHDLNNLLSPISMGVDLLKTYDLEPKCQQIIANMELSARRGIDLVKQVLSFARGVEGARVTIELAEVLREVEAIVERTFPKNVQLTCEVCPRPWAVLGDPTQLNQVLLNLCVNARDAMPEGGHLTICVNNRVFDETYAAMNRDVSPGRYVEIEVSDEGCGIPRELMDRIFEPFFTTKEIGKGTGLGLSTAIGIVRSHGGFVTVYSEPGRGTTFRVCLPALEDVMARSVSTGVAAEPLPRGSGELVLVVDDEVSILQVTRQTLEAFGYRVLTAEDGARAIGLYALHREDVAVVLTDMMMPVMDGPALIAALRRIDPTVRVIASSGLSANGNLIRNGASVKHFLAKPYSAEALLQTLRAVLRDPANALPAAEAAPPAVSP